MEKEKLFEELASSKMEETLVESIKSTIKETFSEEDTEKAMKSIDEAMDCLKTEECKAIMATYLLSKISLGVQFSLITNHKKLMDVAMLHNIGGSVLKSLCDA